MSSKADDYLNQMANAKLSNSAPRISDGIYEPMLIKRIFFVEDGFKGDSFVVEFLVLQSRVQTIPGDMLRAGEAPGTTAPNAVGTICGMAGPLNDKQKREITMSTTMQLFAAMFGWTKEYAESTDPATVLARNTVFKQACAGDGTAFTGYPVTVTTYRALTKKKEIHTRCKFTPYPTTAEEVVKLRAMVLAKG